MCNPSLLTNMHAINYTTQSMSLLIDIEITCIFFVRVR